jgi:hypothetical protein
MVALCKIVIGTPASSNGIQIVFLPNLTHNLSTETNTDRSVVNEENEETFVLLSTLLARLQ